MIQTNQTKISPARLHIYTRLGLSLLLWLGTMLGPTIRAQATVWGFNLLSAPMAVTGSEGEALRITGSGTFDPVTGSITAGGAFTIYNAEELGGITARGNWVATGVTSFTPDGGPNPGQQGGTLTFSAVFDFNLGFSVPVVLTVICPFVDGAFQEANDAVELQIVDELFTRPPGGSGGTALFHIVAP